MPIFPFLETGDLPPGVHTAPLAETIARFGAGSTRRRMLAAIGGEQSAIEDWQIKRDGTERGIVEVAEE